MTTTQFINDKINYLPKGYIFTYSDFLTEEKQNKEAIIKALNRMAKSGKIEKLSKGKFYKPEITRFGKLNPNNYQIVKDLLVDNGKTIGYLTGFNISMVQQKNTINKENIPYLQLLDILRFIKNIPDTTPEKVIVRLIEIFKDFEEKDFKIMIRLSMKYPASTRAILGAILEKMNIDTDDLKTSLNPISTYEIQGIENILPNAKNWNIK